MISELAYLTFYKKKNGVCFDDNSYQSTPLQKCGAPKQNVYMLGGLQHKSVFRHVCKITELQNALTFTPIRYTVKTNKSGGFGGRTKYKDLSHKDEIVISRRIGQIISKTAGDVGFSCMCWLMKSVPKKDK